MKRLIALGAVPLIIGGCVPIIPLPISIVSSGLSGISLLTTGKSTTDHVISAANQQDCVMHRVAFGEEVCQEYADGAYRPTTEYSSHFPGDGDQTQPGNEAPSFWPDEQDTNTAEVPEPEPKKVDELLISSLTTPHHVTTSVRLDIGELETSQSGDDQAIRTGAWERPATPIEVETAPLPPLPQSRPSTASVVSQGVELRYLSLGSFRSSDRANDLVQRFAHLSPTVLTVEVDGRTWRRVAVGPMDKPRVDHLRRKHPKIDGRATWTFVQ